MKYKVLAGVMAVAIAGTAMLAPTEASARWRRGGFGGSVLALLPPGVPRPDGALAVAPGAPARLL